MKNHNPAGGHIKFASLTQRLLSGVVLLTLAGLIWLAWSGRYDREVNRLADWISQQYHAIVR
jgi:hypothetical protein